MVAVPSTESELTGGLQMVMTATPSAPTSISVLPFGAIAAVVPKISPWFLAAAAFLQASSCLELRACKLHQSPP